MGGPASAMAERIVALEDLWGDAVTRRLCARLHTPRVGGPEHLRQVAAASPLELDRNCRAWPIHGLCLTRQILWTLAPVAASIRVTCIEVLRVSRKYSRD